MLWVGGFVLLLRVARFSCLFVVWTYVSWVCFGLGFYVRLRFPFGLLIMGTWGCCCLLSFWIWFAGVSEFARVGW